MLHYIIPSSSNQPASGRWCGRQLSMRHSVRHSVRHSMALCPAFSCFILLINYHPAAISRHLVACFRSPASGPAFGSFSWHSVGYVVPAFSPAFSGIQSGIHSSIQWHSVRHSVILLYSFIISWHPVSGFRSLAFSLAFGPAFGPALGPAFGGIRSGIRWVSVAGFRSGLG